MTPCTPGNLVKWTGGSWDVLPTVPILGVSKDSRTTEPGQIYVALEGPRFDGHDFVPDAFERGAVAAMVRRERCREPSLAGRPLLRVPDPLAALQAAGRACRHAVGARIIAVTGSAGKSTVKEMAAQILSRFAVTAKTRGNYNNHIGLPMSLLSMASDTRFGVFEMGTNHPGEIRGLAALLEPDWGVVTNIGPVHIEFFGSIEAIADEKADLFRALPGDGRAFIGADDPWGARLRGACRAAVTTAGFVPDADYRGIDPRPDCGVCRVREARSGEEMSVELPLPGQHVLADALLAIAVAREAGVPWADICEALRTFTPLPMRWQEESLGGLWIVNDAYNANPLSMRSAIRTFAEVAWQGGRWLVLGAMRELGDHSIREHRGLGQFVAGYPWKGVVVVGEDARSLADGAMAAGFPDARTWVCTAADAAAVLAREVGPDDAILFKASRGVGLEHVLARFRELRQEASHEPATESARKREER